MKNKKNVLYIVDDYILFFSKEIKKLIKYRLNNKALKNGKIANVKLFLSSYKKFIKEHNLNNHLFGDIITIIINPSYTKVDIEILTNVFSSLNYRKINIINEMKIYKFNNSNAYLNYNNNYTILSYMDEYKEKHSYLMENELINEDNLVKIINSKLVNKTIFSFGLNSKIEQLIVKIEENSPNVGFHFSNDDRFLIDEVIAK